MMSRPACDALPAIMTRVLAICPDFQVDSHTVHGVSLPRGRAQRTFSFQTQRRTAHPPPVALAYRPRRGADTHRVGGLKVERETPSKPQRFADLSPQRDRGCLCQRSTGLTTAVPIRPGLQQFVKPPTLIHSRSAGGVAAPWRNTSVEPSGTPAIRSTATRPPRCYLKRMCVTRRPALGLVIASVTRPSRWRHPARQGGGDVRHSGTVGEDPRSVD